jgi:hypothetical protein
MENVFRMSIPTSVFEEDNREAMHTYAREAFNGMVKGMLTATKAAQFEALADGLLECVCNFSARPGPTSRWSEGGG